MSTARMSAFSVLLANGKVLIVGGINDGLSDGVGDETAELFDPATGTWAATGSVPLPGFIMSLTSLETGNVLVTNDQAAAYLYELATGIWRPTGRMEAARYFSSGVLLRSGEVLVVGGKTSEVGDVDLASAELYDPASETWSPTSPMLMAGTLQTTTLLMSGQVFATEIGSNDFSYAEVYTPVPTITMSQMNPPGIESSAAGCSSTAGGLYPLLLVVLLPFRRRLKQSAC
jgi:hypothetical protein